MSTHLARHFEQVRQSLGLKPSQVALRCGCSNLLKIGSRIRQFELSGSITPHLLQKLADFYRIDSSELSELQQRDNAEALAKWNRWADEPIQPYLIIRLMPAIYSQRKMPREIESQSEAETWAGGIAREIRNRCCLIWTRRLSIWFLEDGTVAQRVEARPGKNPIPYSQIGNKRILF